jgi:hypothetical protein
MRAFARVAPAVALIALGHVAGAQRPDSSFAALRSDGNGIPALQTLITDGFAEQTAAVAFTRVATLARLNLTLDPQLAALSSKISIAARPRTAAVALVEIAMQSHVSVRVSTRGQIVVGEARTASPTRAVARDTSISSPVALPAMRSEAAQFEQQRFESTETLGAISMTGVGLRSAPMFIEPDVLRSVQLLPGIEARSDWSAGFNVHGGESDQNLILLDGYPIYSPFHLGGLFSTFIGPTVGRVELRKGSLPVRYGGRLSSVLDVTSAEPLSDRLHGTMEVSLASAIGSVGRTFADGDGSWMIAGRRTYADAVINLYKRDAFPYHFQDVQAHLARRFGNGTRISVTAYDGLDAGGLVDGSQDEVGGNWGNSVVGVTVSKTAVAPQAFGRALGDSATFEQRLSFTRFSTRLDVFDALARADNRVADIRVGGSASLFSGSHTRTFGYELAQQRISYQTMAAFSVLGGVLPLDSLRFRNGSISLFADDVWRPTAALIVEGGLRLDAVTPTGWHGLSPRVSAKYFLSPRLAITAGAGSYAQWLHSLGREEEPVQPFTYWVGSDANTPVSRARDVTAGIERWITPTRMLHMEAFYKRYQDLLIPNTKDDQLAAGDEFLRSGGTSYGVDFLLRQLGSGPFTGWIGYSYALNTRVTADGAHYFPTQDRRHNLNAVGSWRAGQYTLGARINLASGLPTTPVIGGFARSRYNPATHRWVSTTSTPTEESIQGPLNSARLPWYERIDVSVNRSGRLFGADVSPYLSVVNVLNSRNPAAYIYSFTGQPKQASFPNLPFIPTFGVSIAY